ncbi:MAG: HRDC domain-containing protein, partial [Gammaproteobacteria bacterium]|nr:HRDC domain-containing protein [Gammaproteobacteria bacterium]
MTIGQEKKLVLRWPLRALHEAAAWREREAQRVNVPRRRILRDEALHEIAVQAPRSREELSSIRGMSRG